ncbi:hypothetical protein Tco_0286619 [Tanacetum coccineum]
MKKKEEEEAMTKIKGETLIEKEDPRAFKIPIQLEGKINLNALADTGSDIIVMPYRVYKELGREELKNVNRGITMLNHSKAEPMGLLKDVLCQAVLDPFRMVCVWKNVVNFLGSLPVPLQHVDWKPNHTGCFNNQVEGDGQWHAEIRLTDPYGNIYDQGFVTKKTSRRLWEHMTMKPDHHDPNAPDNTRRWRKLRFHVSITCCYEMIDDMLIIKLCVAGTNEEIFTSKAWTNAFNIDERIYSELCHEFYCTYEFDEVCAVDELKTKKIIKFRLYRRAFSWTLLEFAKRLGLYKSEEIEEEGFDVYFQGGLCSDEHFNAQEYWLSISQEENLSLSRSHAFTIRNPILRVLHKMITYSLCQMMTGYDKIQKNDLWLLSMFDARHQNGYANVAWLIARWMKRNRDGSQKESMICCGQALDTTTLRELIDSKARLIHEAPKPGVSRVSIPRPPRASIQDLYERMGSMEIRQGAIERMSYRQSYH